MNLTERTEKMWPNRDALVLAYQGMCSMLTNNSAVIKTGYELNSREKVTALNRYLAVPRAYFEKIREEGFSGEKIGEFERLLKETEKGFMSYEPTKAELKAQKAEAKSREIENRSKKYVRFAKKPIIAHKKGGEGEYT